MACLALFALPWSEKGMKISKRYARLTFYSPQATANFIRSSNQRLTSNAMDGNSRPWGAWRLRHDMQEIADARKTHHGGQQDHHHCDRRACRGRHGVAQLPAAQQLAAAQTACSTSLKAARAAKTAWLKLVDGDAKATTKTDKAQAKDAKTLDTLAAEPKAKAPEITACAGDSADRMGKAAERISLETAWYATHTKSLKQAVKAVQASIVDETVADTQALFDSTAGKVADEAICTALKEAIGKCNTKAIADATGKVNASVKEKADADAANTAAKAAAQMAQAQAQRNTGSSSSTSRRSSEQTYSRSPSSMAGIRSGGSTGSTGGQTGQQSSGGSTNSSSSNGEYCIAGEPMATDTTPSHSDVPDTGSAHAAHVSPSSANSVGWKSSSCRFTRAV